jgi:uncharacterized protein (TIGR03067 family)
MLRSNLRPVVLLAALASLGLAPVPKPKEKPDPAKEELKKLQGKWELVSCSLGRQRLKVRPGEEGDVYKGDQLTTFNGGEAVTRWTVTLDPTKSPKQMDKKGKDGALLLAIYRLEGDTLTVCYKNEQGAKGRPADFTPGKGVGVEVLRRKKR